MKDPQTVLNCSISEPTQKHLFVVWICGLAHLKLNWEEATDENAEPVQVRAVQMQKQTPITMEANE